MSHRWKLGVRLKRTYFQYFLRKKSNPINAPDIITNKTLEESALPGKFFFQSYVSKSFA